MEILLIVGAFAVAAALLWWGADDPEHAGGLDRRRLDVLERRAAERRRADASRHVSPLARLGPRRRRDAGTGLVARLADHAADLDGDTWRQAQDGLRRVHGRL